MAPADWLALFLAIFIVPFTIVSELRDIVLCRIAIANAGYDSTVWNTRHTRRGTGNGGLRVP